MQQDSVGLGADGTKSVDVLHRNAVLLVKRRMGAEKRLAQLRYEILAERSKQDQIRSENGMLAAL